MDCDLDLFDDLLPTKNARAGRKFQPKSKPQPTKKSSGSLPSTNSVQSVNNNSNGENPSISLVASFVDTSETLVNKSPLESNEFSFVEPQFSRSVATEKSVDPTDGLPSQVVMPDSNVDGDWHSNLGKSTIENADVFFGLESLDDYLSQPTIAEVNNANRSPPKVNIGAETSIPLSETPTVDISDPRNQEEGLDLPVVSPIDESTFRVSTASLTNTYPEVPTCQDPLTCVEANVSTSGGDVQVDDRTSITEEVEAFYSWDTLDIMPELTTSSGRKTRKFQPKPKVTIDKEKTCTNPDSTESLSCWLDVQPVPSETEYVDEVHDFSSFNFPDSGPADQTSELPVNEEPTKVTDMISEEHEEVVPPMPGKVSRGAKNGRRKTPVVSDLATAHKKASTSGRENATGRPLRQLRKRTNACELVDESEDEAHDDGDFIVESPNGSVRNEDDRDSDEHQVANETQNRRARGKSKKPVGEKEKQVRKRKRANEVPDQSTKEPPKKFPHSTRRNKRKVDKVLLLTPEDEIDPQKLHFRDLILLAEYRERMSKKEATRSETPLTGQSGGNSFTRFNEDETFASERGDDSDDERSGPGVQESSSYVNYQTYMKKTPRSRWSKQDTELFYEAVQQFGTDLSLIQQLFPDRTREQVKLKFKKEERQHPLRLNEALTNRTKDLTRFEQVCQRLQQVAAQEKQNSNRDDEIDLTGEEEELTPTPDITEEEAKTEPTKEEVQNVEPEPIEEEVQSPIKSDDNEDESYRWNQYKSEF